MKRMLEILTNGGMYILTLAQTNDIFQLVELILSIAMTLFILIINIITWAKKATKDGKIDKEEIDELVDIISETEKKNIDKGE